MDVNEAAPTVALPKSYLETDRRHRSWGKAKVPKKEQTLDERAIHTNKRKERRIIVRAMKAHRGTEVATRVATETALEMQAKPTPCSGYHRSWLSLCSC
jgi:hypothetical protein